MPQRQIHCAAALSDSNRRQLLLGALLSSTALTRLILPDSAQADSLSLSSHSGLNSRFESSLDLRQPLYMAPWDAKLIYYPRWLFGEWLVTSTLTGITMPLGRKFVPERFMRESEASPEEGGPGSRYSYRLRWYSTLPDTFDNNARVLLGLGMPHDAIISDRAFNTRSMIDSFLGYPGAVTAVAYDPSAAPLKETVILSTQGPDKGPLPPRRIEIYINALRSEAEGDAVFRTSELARQVFVGPQEAQVYDYDILNQYTLEGPGKVSGRQRYLLYLQPQDQLYFQSGGRAVAAHEFTYEMTRLPVPVDAPRGAVACVDTPKFVAQCI